MYSEENGLHHMLRVQYKTGIEHRESYYMYCSSLKLRDDFAMAWVLVPLCILKYVQIPSN